MKSPKHTRLSAPLMGSLSAVVLAIMCLAVTASPTVGGDHPWGTHLPHALRPSGSSPRARSRRLNGGAWYWMRSPEQEKTVVMNLFNRYCIRCHGVDGRGVWDIPGIPDFTDVRWQNYRTDAEIVRIIIEGRGAVMPQFRGALALDEAWGLAHYLRTFVPGTRDVQAGAPQSTGAGSLPARPQRPPAAPARPRPRAPAARPSRFEATPRASAQHESDRAARSLAVVGHTNPSSTEAS